MKLSQLLTPAQILLSFRAEDKWAAIRTMATTMATTGHLTPPMAAAAREALVSREQSMTTGMEHGVAIPHAALDDLPALVGVMAIAPDGIPFDTLDGQPGRILVGLLIPRHEKLLHIRTLRDIAKLLSREDARNRLLECASVDQVLDTIRAEE